MKQICRFNTRPATIVDGGYKKGRYTVWLNLSVSEIEKPDIDSEKFESITDRLVLSNNSVASFLEVVDEQHLAIASNDELMSILKYFQSENDIESWKAIRRKQIKGYDQTEKVNRFYLSGLPLWLDKATRVGLVNSISAEKREGNEVTDLWFESIMIQLPVDDALAKLDKIELYAKNCYNVTASHIAEIEQIDNLEELQQYDITAEYPPFLELQINQ